MADAFAAWLRSFSLEVMDAGRRMRGGLPKLLDPGDEQPRYLKAIQRRNWNALLAAGRAELKARNRSIGAAGQHQRRVAGLVERLPLARTAADQLVPLKDRPYHQRSRDNLRAMLKGESHSTAEIKRLLQVYDEIRPADARRGIENALDMMVARIDETLVRHEAAAMGATLAMAVAYFNKAFQQPPALKSSPDAYLRAAEGDLDAAEADLWRALKEGDSFQVWGVATNLRQGAGRRLLAGGVWHAGALAAQRQSAPGDAQLGRLALEVGTLVRRQLRAVALGLVLSNSARWHKDTGALAAWTRAANRAARAGSARRWPAMTSLRTLSQQPGRFDGQPRTIEGLVADVAITHRGAKAISTVRIEADGWGVNAVLPYIKADSGGLVPGAWARVSGTWRASSSEADGPALELDRWNLEDHGRQGWPEAADLELAPVFTPVSHGLIAEWSWEPGTNGASNQLRYGTWFASGRRS